MNGRELVLFVFDLPRVGQLAHCWITPYNSKSASAGAYMRADSDIFAALEQATANTASRKSAEILIPVEVPLVAVPKMVFPDAQTRDSWYPAFRDHLDDSIDAPRPRLALDEPFWGFPPDYRIDRRTVPTSESAWTDLEDLDDEPPDSVRRTLESLADFYDDGEPDDPEWYERSERD